MLAGRGEAEEQRCRIAALEAQVGGVVLFYIHGVGAHRIPLLHSGPFETHISRSSTFEASKPQRLLQVVEAAAAQEYQLRLRDAAMVEEARKLGDKVAAEAAAAALRCEGGAPGRQE